MIVDYFTPESRVFNTPRGSLRIGEWNSDSEKPFIYERTRDADGVLHERVLQEGDEDYISPSCWVDAAITDATIHRIESRYPGVSIDRTKTAVGIDGVPLIKLTASHPNHLWNIKDEYPHTYEADLIYTDQYLIQNYPDGIPDFHPRIWYFDLEWDPKEDFTTVMAVVDNQAPHPVVFAWKQDLMSEHTKWIDRYGGYELRLYLNEESMHEGFLQYLDERDPDILVAHAGNWADIPHLYRRLKDPSRLSPIGEVIAPRKDTGYDESAQPIKGRIVFDSAARGITGSGFEAIWQKSGRGQMSSRSLNWVAQSLDLGEKLTDRIEGMTVHNGWYDYFDDFVDYCLVDTTLLRDIDEMLHAVEFHVAMMKLCGVGFRSTYKVTRYFRGLIGRRTDLKAPSSKAQNREELQAAYIPDPIPGRHEGVALVDYASLYPNIILSLNLSWETKKQNAGSNNVKSPGNGTHWSQDEVGLLPSVVSEMLALRKDYKKKMYEATDTNEKLGYDMLQTATKVAVNALYGMVSMGKIGGMWSDLDIGRTITYMGRESIKFLLAESERQGYRGLYGHTDSAFIQVPFDEAENLAAHLTQESRKQLDMPYMDVELEAYFDYWISAETKNRYFGIKSWPESDKGKMKVSGFEIKASNAAPISKETQGVLFDLVGKGAEEEEVTAAIRPIVKSILNGERPVSDLSPYGRIKKGMNNYTANVPMPVRAAKYYNENIATDNPFRPGDGAQWVYIDAVPEGLPDSVTFPKDVQNTNASHFVAKSGETKTFPANVVAFREEDEIKDFSIDYDVVVEKMVKAKIQPVYSVMGWDMEKAASPQEQPAVYW
jgi:DNA polymerase I